ncbi:MAG: glycosyltransferase [Cruoricaptor ignavus]|nr:glycosyltransferase [Cruoricaptor ignavus]
MKNKICHLTSVHHIDDSRIFKKECVSLAKAGFDVSIIACGEKGFEDVKDGVRRYSIKTPKSNRIKRMFTNINVVYKKALEVNADLYHFHDPELLTIALKLKKKNKKVIFDSHEFTSEQIKIKPYLPKLVRNFVSKLFTKYENYVIKRLDGVIIPCSLDGKNYFEGKTKNVVYIDNTPLFSDVSVVNFGTRNKIFHLGTLTYERGIKHLVQASHLSQTTLVLAGRFSPPSFEQELRELPDFASVEYKGFIGFEEKIAISEECFAGVSTLLNVGQYPRLGNLPTKVYEFMGMGIPVILSNIETAKKINKKYNFGICVDPSNPKEIADAILYLKNNKEIAKEMGDNARKAFENEFNWKIDENKLLKFYNEILEK